MFFTIRTNVRSMRSMYQCWKRQPKTMAFHSERLKSRTRTEFWLEKFDKNVKNDQLKQEKLRELGWKVIVIWECEIKKDLIKTMEWLEQEIKYHDIEGRLR